MKLFKISAEVDSVRDRSLFMHNKYSHYHSLFYYFLYYY
jgi:hypothetical protein